jgi:hypothetical protein
MVVGDQGLLAVFGCRLSLRPNLSIWAAISESTPDKFISITTPLMPIMSIHDSRLEDLSAVHPMDIRIGITYRNAW